MHIFVAKLSGNINLQYTTSVLNLSLALESIGRKRLCIFSGNMGSMPLHYSGIVFGKTWIPPFINSTTTETIEKLCNHFEKCQYVMVQSTRSMEFSSGFDDTVVIKL